MYNTSTTSLHKVKISTRDKHLGFDFDEQSFNIQQWKAFQVSRTTTTS